MKKTKICFVMPYHLSEGVFGGAEVQAWLLAQELVRRGFSVCYVAQSMNNKHGQREFIDGVKVRWVRYAHHFKWLNGLDYYRVLKEENPDFVIERMTSFLTGVAGLYCRKYHKKFIWICTDNEAPRRWHFLKNQIKTNRTNQTALVKAFVFFINAIIYDISRHFGMRNVTCAFTQNEYQRVILKESFHRDSYLMISGYEVPQNISPPYERLNDGIVLWVANFGLIKRPEKFVELARLSNNLQLRFVMIGGKDNESYIERIFRDKPNNLEWLGKLPFEEAQIWFAQSAFYVSTSIEEGFPNTFIQAWLHGVPVITLGVDPDGVIQKYRLGYVAKNLEDVLKTMNFLSIHPEKYAEISKKVYEYAKLHHSVEKVCDNFIDIVFN